MENSGIQYTSNIAMFSTSSKTRKVTESKLRALRPSKSNLGWGMHSPGYLTQLNGAFLFTHYPGKIVSWVKAIVSFWAGKVAKNRWLQNTGFPIPKGLGGPQSSHNTSFSRPILTTSPLHLNWLTTRYATMTTAAASDGLEIWLGWNYYIQVNIFMTWSRKHQYFLKHLGRCHLGYRRSVATIWPYSEISKCFTASPWIIHFNKQTLGPNNRPGVADSTWRGSRRSFREGRFLQGFEVFFLGRCWDLN